MSENHLWRINVMIRHLALRHRNAIQHRLETELGIHIGQELIMLVLYRRGPMLQRDMLQYLAIEPPTLSIISTRMEKAGLIIRTRSDRDGRARVLSLTDKGSEMIPAIFAIENEIAETVTNGMNQTEVESWLDLMRTALVNLDGESSEIWTDDMIVVE